MDNKQTLQQLMKDIKNSYGELKNCEHGPIQSTIIWSLKPKCQEALKIIDKSQLISGMAVKKRQITDILQRVEKLEKEIQQKEKRHSMIGNGGRVLTVNRSYRESDQWQEPVNLYAKQSEASTMGSDTPNPQIPDRRQTVRIMRSIALQEIQSVNMKISKEELQQILKRMQQNKEVINDINDMIIEQGHDLDKVEENIQKTYENVKEGNQLLEEGQKYQKRFLGLDKVRGAFHKTAQNFWGFVAWPWKALFGKNKQGKKSSTTPDPETMSTPIS